MNEEISIRLAEEVSATATRGKEFPPQRQYLIESNAPELVKWEKGYLASQRVEGKQFITWIFMARTTERVFATLEIQSPSALFVYIAKGQLGFQVEGKSKIIKFDQDRLIEFYSTEKNYPISISPGLTVVYYFCLQQPFLEELSQEYPSLIPLLKSLINKSQETIFLASGKINPGTIDDFIRLKMGKKEGLALQTILSWLVFELIYQLKPNGSSRILTTREKAFYAKDYIDENMQLGSVPGVNEIAERYSMHADTLNRVFSRAFGVSLKKYINRAKMLEGYRLLTLEEMPVMQAAERLGYQSTSSFSTQFRAYYGISPSEAIASYINRHPPE